MIIEMKKLEILLFHREQEHFLTTIRNAGVVHIAPTYDSLSSEAVLIRSKIIQLDTIIMNLKIRKSSKSETFTSAIDCIDQYEKTLSDRNDIQQRLELCQRTILPLKPWGEIDFLQLEELRSAGVTTSFYEISDRQSVLFEDRNYEIITQQGNHLYIVVFDTENPRIDNGIEPITIPHQSLESLIEDQKSLQESLISIETCLDQLASAVPSLKNYRAELESEFHLECARSSMLPVAKEHILHVIGWIPASQSEAIESIMEQFSCWYEISRPTHEDDVPVELVNRGFAKLFEPITKIFALPNYFEIDPTPFFAPFYALFFGLCLGDVGYGLLLMIGALVISTKLTSKGKLVAYLVSILGFSTFVSGIFLNSCLGHPLFKMVGAEDGWLSFGSELAVFQAIPQNGTVIFPMMAFAIYLGIFQMLLAIILKAINRSRMEGRIHAIHPIALFCMTIACTIGLAKSNFLEMGTFTLGVIHIGSLLASIHSTTVWSLFGFGCVLLFLFNNPDKPFQIRIPLGFWVLYEFTTGLIGDSLSYIRLFALGLSGGLLASAFNQIAQLPITVNGTVHWDSPLVIVTILIMIIGHLTNFALSLIGSFVHPLRLTFVEFYKNLEFKGGAKPFAPLSLSNRISTNK